MGGLRMGWGCAACINGNPRRVHTPRRGQLWFTLSAVLLLPLFLACISALPPSDEEFYLESHCDSRWNKTH